MSVLNVFCTTVKYEYKTRILSFCSLVVFIFMCLLIFGPLIITFQTGGFWIRTRTYVETPRVQFTHKYLLIAERYFETTPIVCSTFTVYQRNLIKDNCSLVKIQEVDVNNDKKNDILKFELQFYNTQPIRTFKLLLYFEFQFENIIKNTINSLASFDYLLPYESQKIHVTGDLSLNQKTLIYDNNFNDIHTLDLSNHSLVEVLTHNARKKFSAQINNIQATWETGFASDEPIIISGEIFYSQQLLYYQPSIWEELKWFWIQYLSFFIAFSYFIRKFLKFLLSRSYLKSYIVIPWKEK
ncbi:transmembrane protein 231 [Chelonus insularis]|uniref:transmembrane protein 231 n=1 Tax=Chelonus insularis TaxID=460826 RepID=UPI00158C2F6B|nr:transmembrane protein 231-like [Chelonus insularis]